MDKRRRGKSATEICNLGTSIGSEIWVQGSFAESVTVPNLLDAFAETGVVNCERATPSGAFGSHCTTRRWLRTGAGDGNPTG